MKLIEVRPRPGADQLRKGGKAMTIDEQIAERVSGLRDTEDHALVVWGIRQHLAK